MHTFRAAAVVLELVLVVILVLWQRPFVVRASRGVAIRVLPHPFQLHAAILVLVLVGEVRVVLNEPRRGAQNLR